MKRYMKLSPLPVLWLASCQMVLLGCFSPNVPVSESSASPVQPTASQSNATSTASPSPDTAAALAEFRQIAKQQPDTQPIVDRISQHPAQVGIMVKRCESTVPEAMARGSQFYALSDSSYLVMLQCYLGAYQGSSVLYLYSETKGQAEVQPLNLEQIDRDGGVTTKTQSNLITGYAKFDPEKNTLVVRNKYRGVGDCGTIGTYSLKDQQFVLTEYQADFECDGTLNFQKIAP